MRIASTDPRSGQETVQWDIGLLLAGEAGYVQVRVRPPSLQAAQELHAYNNFNYRIQADDVAAVTGVPVVTRINRSVKIAPPALGPFQPVSGLILPTLRNAPVIAGGNFVLAGNPLIGLDGSSLIGLDGSSLIRQDGSTLRQLLSGLVGMDGSTLVGKKGSTLVGMDGSTLQAASALNAIRLGSGGVGVVPR